MPTTLSFAKFGIEETYGMPEGIAPNGEPWHYIRPLTPGLSGDNNVIMRPDRWGNREQGYPIMAGPYTGGGPLGVEAHAEEVIALLYAAFGQIDTTEVGVGPEYYTHCFTPGICQKSIYYMECLGPLDPCAPGVPPPEHFLIYPGTTINSLGIVGDMGSVLRWDFDLHSSIEAADGSLVVTPVWSTIDPFTGVIGEITRTADPWDENENWNVNIDFGTLHRRAWGQRNWHGAQIGPVTTTVSLNAYFATDTELKRFLGDTAHDLTTGALVLQDGLEEFDGLVITAETDDVLFAGPPIIPYTFTLTIPHLVWRTRGSVKAENDYLRLPLEGVARYDTEDEYSVQICIDNGMPEASVTDPLVAPV